MGQGYIVTEIYRIDFRLTTILSLIMVLILIIRCQHLEKKLNEQK